MHVLTKIFIVLVSLLSVLLVPLVVVYAYNENSYQARLETAETRAAAAQAAFETAKATSGAALASAQAEIQQLTTEATELRKQVDRQVASIRELEQRVAEAENMDTEIRTHIGTLAAALDAGQDLTQVLIDDLGHLRSDALASERQKVELDEALRDTMAKLDVAVEARRALQEELQRLKDENAGALATIREYVALYPNIEEQRGEIAIGVVDLDATVIAVSRRDDRTLAEINAGSRDGVEVGAVFILAHGAEFLGQLRIISVDINRATGVVEMEDAAHRGRVEVGNQAISRKGR